MAKNTDKAQLALGDHAARQLANATMTETVWKSDWELAKINT
ncbi:hypothetical protein ACFMJ9_13055, partial [Acinetobacter baumannii]